MKPSVIPIAFALLLASCSSGPSKALTPTANPTAAPTSLAVATAHASAATGSNVALPDGTRLTLPPGAVSADVPISLDQSRVSPTPPDFGTALGHAVNINLQGQILAAPATLELPYDPAKLPPGMTENAIFAAYFDEATRAWVPVGGIADPSRRVVVVQITHASWWTPYSWLTDALAQGLVAGFKLDFGTVFVTAQEAFKDCIGSPGGVIIDESDIKDLLGSCVEKDDPVHPRLRIVNRRTSYVNASAKPGNATSDFAPETESLGPLDRQSFTVDFSGAPVSEPFVIHAAVDLPYTVAGSLLDLILLIPGVREAIDTKTSDAIRLLIHDNQHVLSAAERGHVPSSGVNSGASSSR